MQIRIKTQHLNLSEKQRKSIQTKVEKLQNLADRLGDESAEFRVEIKHEKSRKLSDAYICQLTIFAPQAVIRAETRHETIENAVDDCLNKIKTQIVMLAFIVKTLPNNINPAQKTIPIIVTRKLLSCK